MNVIETVILANPASNYINVKQTYEDESVKNNTKYYTSSKDIKKTVFSLLEITSKRDNVTFVLAVQKPTTRNNITAPAVNTEWLNFIKAVYFSKYDVYMYLLVNNLSIKVDESYIDYLDDDIFRYFEECSNVRLLESNVSLINKLGLRNELRKRTIEQFKDYLEFVINESGYDVELSSAVKHEGLSVYNFYDGSTQVEGIRKHSKIYESYAHTLNDLLKMIQNIQFYQSVGLEPERTKEREDMLRRSAVAKGIEFNVVGYPDIDDIPLEEVERWLDGVDDLETPTSCMGLNFQHMYS